MNFTIYFTFKKKIKHSYKNCEMESIYLKDCIFCTVLFYFFLCRANSDIQAAEGKTVNREKKWHNLT